MTKPLTDDECVKIFNRMTTQRDRAYMLMERSAKVLSTCKTVCPATVIAAAEYGAAVAIIHGSQWDSLAINSLAMYVMPKGAGQ